MKKLVLASVMALASTCLVAPSLQAQDQSGTITIKDPAELNAYNQAITQSDPKAKAAALEAFLTQYPQTVLKNAVLETIVGAYQQAGDSDHLLVASQNLLQVEPNNLEALLFVAVIKDQKCKAGLTQQTGVESDTQSCDDGAIAAQKGLMVSKPATGVTDADWKKQTDAAYPIFHSASADDDVYSKKDYKGAIDEYKKELMLFPEAQTESGAGLVATLNIAEAYVKLEPSDAKAVSDAATALKAITDPTAQAPAQKVLADAKAKDSADTLSAIWFYARAVDFAPANYKPLIEKKLDYWYNKYHGGLDGLDAVKSQAQATLFPPATFAIKTAPTPAEKIHAILVNTPDLSTLALADKELVLAYGEKEDADKLWAVMKDKETPVPGTVIDASTTTIKVAVTDDAKQAKTADFIVNMKTPLTEREVPAVGSELKLMSAGGPELDGTYDTYTQVAATDTVPQSAQIVLRDASLQSAKKTVPHKPTAAHRTAH